MPKLRATNVGAALGRKLAHAVASSATQRKPPANDGELGPTQVKRMRDAAARGVLPPEWGSELGRLFLENKIDQLQYAAGKRWDHLAHQYRNAIGIFPVRTASLERAAPATVADPNSIDGKRQAKREAEAIERFFQAHSVLVNTGAEALVRDLVERDYPLAGTEDLIRVRKALSVLAAFWKLDR